ncbi:ASCH domain-containing protein, partial [Escherichia coli]
MKVLLSIKPEFAEKILNGTKRFEFRKGIFKNPQISTVVIYATMPLGKVV